MFDICHPGTIEVVCSLDWSYAQTSAWMSTLIPVRYQKRVVTAPSIESVRVAAAALPLKQAESLWLVDVCGCDYAQAAAEAGADERTIANRVRRARQSIHKITK